MSRADAVCPLTVQHGTNGPICDGTAATTGFGGTKTAVYGEYRRVSKENGAKLPERRGRSKKG
jgi:CDGSH-type Zn-finger protein